jgi:uncharacterized protein with beta-barrel porin domain
VLHGVDFGACHSRILLVGRARACRVHADCDPDDGTDRHLRHYPPNPVTTAIVSQPGSTNVTINMLSGAQLNVNSNAVVLNAGGQVTNNSGAIIQGTTGINSTGPLTVNNNGQITGTSGPGVVINGAGNSTLTNTGSINGSGTAVQFNTVAGSSQTFNNSGNGSINGNFVGSGDGAIVITNSGNFNGGITINGNGSNSITTAAGRNINGQVSISGNSQNTIVNGGAFNNGLVISGAGSNDITNQAGAFINQTFSVAGSQNTITNAGTLNNGLTVGNGVNTITNQSGATINQTFSVTGTQNTITNFGTLNNGVTVSGDGINSITNGQGGVINQAVNVTGTQNTITNFGTLNNGVTVSGMTVLTNNGSYFGATTVNAGALTVIGSIANSPVTVNSGAALIGSGTVGSTVVNAGGFLVPGPVGTPGNMTVAGNLALQSGAFYVVQVNPTTASTTNVSGTASLAGTVGAIFAPGTYLSRSYTILTAAGGVTGTFDAGATRGLPAGFLPSLTYTGNTVVLSLIGHLVPIEPPVGPPTLSTPTGPLRLSTLPSVPGLPDLPDQPSTAGQSSPLPNFTTNQLNAGLAIDNFFNNGGALPPAFVSLYGLTGSNLTNALDQLSGEAATGAQKAGFQLTDQFLNVMLDPFVDGRSGVGGADHPALGFAPERETMPSEIALAYASVLKAPPLTPVYEPRWTAWGGAYGGSNRTTGDLAITGSHDLSARTVGGAAGLDYHLTPDTVVGLALAGGGTNWGLSQGLGGGKSDAFQAGVYGATRSGPAYLAAAFAFANHWMSTDRTAVGDHLSADFNAQSYSGRVEGGYRFGTPFGGITPYAAIQGQSFHTPAYIETDGIANGFALAFGSRDASDTRSELGTRFDRVLAVYSNAVLALRGRVAWAHDWVSDPTLTPAFQALPGASFIVNGATLAKNSALTSAGAELRLANGVTLLAKFDGEFAARSSTYAGTGTLRYRW